MAKKKECKKCNGMGWVKIGYGIRGLKPCPRCRGTGKKEESK
jgi:DnaJ-class molecular chaperone